MPRTGTLAVKMAGLAEGAAPSITEAGPPDSTMALGPNCSILAWSTDWKGWISQYTPASRRRRAMSWVTWEPKSTISRRSDMRRYKESRPRVQLAFVWIAHLVPSPVLRGRCPRRGRRGKAAQAISEISDLKSAESRLRLSPSGPTGHLPRLTGEAGESRLTRDLSPPRGRGA